MTNKKPIINKTISCLIIMLIEPKAAPIDKEPVSPIKIFAGCALNHKKPKHEPTKAEPNTANSPAPGIKNKFRYSEKILFPTKYAIKARQVAVIITGTIANPSNPSVRFTPLDVPIITRKAKIGKKTHKSNK